MLTNIFSKLLNQHNDVNVVNTILLGLCDKIINNIPEPVFIKNREHEWLLVNDVCCEFLGYSRESLIGKTDYDFFPKKEADIFWELEDKAFKEGTLTTNEENITDANGIGHLVTTKKSTIFDPEIGETLLIGIISDITALRKTEVKLKDAIKTLEELSHTDQLTSIPNRRAYDQQLLREIANAKRGHDPISLLMLDIDLFKSFNDSYGHEHGDVALISIAKAIAESLPRATDFVARYGGEEFVIILPKTDLQGAIYVAEQILTSVAEQEIKHAYSEVADVMTLSIGIYSCSNNYENLLQKADKALYQAKKNGRNRFEVFEE